MLWSTVVAIPMRRSWRGYCRVLLAVEAFIVSLRRNIELRGRGRAIETVRRPAGAARRPLIAIACSCVRGYTADFVLRNADAIRGKPPQRTSGRASFAIMRP